jgi:hypothetical protein
MVIGEGITSQLGRAELADRPRYMDELRRAILGYLGTYEAGKK